MFEFDDKIPVYLQIVNDFKRRIASGEIKCGQKFPSVRELSERLKVNPNTVVHAYRELDILGLTETQRGTGTFVKNSDDMVRKLKQEEGSLLVTNFLSAMKQTGLTDKEILEMIQNGLINDSAEENGGNKNGNDE